MQTQLRCPQQFEKSREQGSLETDLHETRHEWEVCKRHQLSWQVDSKRFIHAAVHSAARRVLSQAVTLDILIQHPDSADSRCLLVHLHCMAFPAKLTRSGQASCTCSDDRLNVCCAGSGGSSSSDRLRSSVNRVADGTARPTGGERRNRRRLSQWLLTMTSSGQIWVIGF